MIVSKSILSDENIYCFVGDAGEVNPTQKMVVKALANSDCSMVWHLGDITQLGVQSLDDPELHESFLTPFKPFIETEIPFYLAVGNHDIIKVIQVYIFKLQKIIHLLIILVISIPKNLEEHVFLFWIRLFSTSYIIFIKGAVRLDGCEMK